MNNTKIEQKGDTMGEAKNFYAIDMKADGSIVNLDIEPKELKSVLETDRTIVIIQFDFRQIYLWIGKLVADKHKEVAKTYALQVQNQIKNENNMDLDLEIQIQGLETDKFKNLYLQETVQEAPSLMDVDFLRQVKQKHYDSQKIGKSPNVKDPSALDLLKEITEDIGTPKRREKSPITKPPKAEMAAVISDLNQLLNKLDTFKEKKKFQPMSDFLIELVNINKKLVIRIEDLLKD